MYIIPYIITAMIAYDFIIHVMEFKGWHWKFIESPSILSYIYPHARWKKNYRDLKSPIERANFLVIYDWLWTSYWGIALVLSFIWLIGH